MSDEITIPTHHQEFCKKAARLAREHGLHEYSGTFTPADGWSGSITFHWKEGRHGAESNEIFIESHVRVWERVSSNEPKTEAA